MNLEGRKHMTKLYVSSLTILEQRAKYLIGLLSRDT